MALAVNRKCVGFCKDEFAVSYRQGEISLLFQRLKIKAKEPRPANKKAVRRANRI